VVKAGNTVEITLKQLVAATLMIEAVVSGTALACRKKV